MRRIAVVTVARSDYGIYRPLLRRIAESPDLELLLIAAGMHLEPAFGDTLEEILADGFAPAARVDLALTSDTPGGIAHSMGLGVSRFHVRALDDEGNKSLPMTIEVDFGGSARMPMLARSPADRNADGYVSVSDLADFLNAYATDDRSADVNGDGFVDQDDLITFIQMWNDARN